MASSALVEPTNKKERFQERGRRRAQEAEAKPSRLKGLFSVVEGASGEDATKQLFSLLRLFHVKTPPQGRSLSSLQMMHMGRLYWRR